MVVVVNGVSRVLTTSSDLRCSLSTFWTFFGMIMGATSTCWCSSLSLSIVMAFSSTEWSSEFVVSLGSSWNTLSRTRVDGLVHWEWEWWCSWIEPDIDGLRTRHNSTESATTASWLWLSRCTRCARCVRCDWWCWWCCCWWSEDAEERRDEFGEEYEKTWNPAIDIRRLPSRTSVTVMRSLRCKYAIYIQREMRWNYIGNIGHK